MSGSDGVGVGGGRDRRLLLSGKTTENKLILLYTSVIHVPESWRNSDMRMARSFCSLRLRLRRSQRVAMQTARRTKPASEPAMTGVALIGRGELEGADLGEKVRGCRGRRWQTLHEGGSQLARTELGRLSGSHQGSHTGPLRRRRRRRAAC